ncbi:MAG: hypothetical protein VR73_06900 [Gammaproteobacteria bacterium BRH_c0]|nr:MAG: hypothetical protein VR73_06900 [Gammaproteobacteria bacterium BRH_c0]
MKMFLLVLVLLLASNGEHYSHEHGFSALSSTQAAAAFKLPELVLNGLEQSADLALPDSYTALLIHQAAFSTPAITTPASPSQPALAGHPIRGPPTANV